MWPYYGVHITVCMACLVFVLCQPVHSCIDHPYTWTRFLFLEIFLWRLVFVLFDNNLLTTRVPIITVLLLFVL